MQLVERLAVATGSMERYPIIHVVSADPRRPCDGLTEVLQGLRKVLVIRFDEPGPEVVVKVVGRARFESFAEPRDAFIDAALVLRELGHVVESVGIFRV